MTIFDAVVSLLITDFRAVRSSLLSLSDHKKAYLWYKGISAKLTAKVDRMLEEKLIVKVMDENRVKLGLENVD